MKGLRELFHYPAPGRTTLGRLLSVVSTADASWAAVQKRAQSNEIVSVYRKGRDAIARFDLESDGYCHQPCIAAHVEGGVAVVWNEARGDGWAIQYARYDRDASAFGAPQEVHSSGGVLLPPAAAFFQGALWVAWPGLSRGNLRIHVARHTPEGCEVLPPISPEGLDAFRPSLSANEERLFLCWDQYKGKRYEVCAASYDGTAWSDTVTLSMPGERWLCAKVLAGAGDECFLTWVALKEVTDDRGIIDHFPFAAVARLSAGTVECLLDERSPENPRIVADLREGLLAANTYMGYHGLRRNPHLARSEDGALWCLWEARLEAEKTHIAGHLLGRRWTKEDGWGPASLLHSGGIGYGAAGRMHKNALGVFFFRFGVDPEAMIEAASVDPNARRPVDRGAGKWRRWRQIEIAPAPKPSRTASAAGKTYRLFWADTHVHSVVSPDAEGEVDELIHFARDLAGLDAAAITDNDYYPHKAVSEAEWRIHQAFASHYTSPGGFVLFPGYEFTFHRRDLKPDFNHRIVLYARAGGTIHRRIDPETCTDRQLYEALAGKDAVTYPHHTTYKIVDAGLDRNVEICSSWRVVMEESDFTLRAIERGQRTGFIGSSDTHRAVPGLGGALTGIFAEELTPEGLFAAYRARRLIATQGRFVFVDFRVGDVFIGGEGVCDGVPAVAGTIDAPEPIAWFEVVRDGEVIRRQDVRDRTCRFRFKDGSASDGEHFYFLRVKLVGDPSFNTDPAEHYDGAFKTQSRYPHNLARAQGPFAWTSPVWVTVR